MSDQDEGSSFKIKDRRRFDSAGNEKSEEVQEKASLSEGNPRQETAGNEKKETVVGSSGASRADSDKKPEASEHKSYPAGEIDLSSFVMSLATQALMQLGEMKPPEGVQVEVNKAQAKQTIDILIMIQEKTRGNLDANEEKFLEEILHQLRISFVRHP